MGESLEEKLEDIKTQDITKQTKHRILKKFLMFAAYFAAFSAFSLTNPIKTYAQDIQKKRQRKCRLSVE